MQPGGLAQSRPFKIGVIAALVVVLAIGGYAVHRASGSAVADAGQMPGYTPPPPERPSQTVYFTGDSVIQGHGATYKNGNPFGFVDMLAGRLTWTTVNGGQGGTGFVNDGHDASKSFDPLDSAKRLKPIIAAKPNFVVIGAGRNDGKWALHDPAKLTRAVNDVLDTLHAGLPKAKIVVLGPFYWHTPDEVRQWNEVGRVTEKVIGAAVATHTGYAQLVDVYGLDPLGPGDETKEVIRLDHFHPNDDGYARLAYKLARPLLAAGIPEGPGDCLVAGHFEDCMTAWKNPAATR